MAGLLQAHWTLPGFQPDFCSPGQALVLELRQSKQTQEYLVRVFYTAQTFDQLRQLTPLNFLDEPPATMQLAIPGGSKSATNLDVEISTFQRLLKAAIGEKYVQPFGQEHPPAVIHDAPLN